MSRLKLILALLIVLLSLALAVVSWRFFSAGDIASVVEMLPEEVDAVLQDLHYTHNEEGRELWSLDADQAEYQKQSSLVLLKTVRARYFATPQFGDIDLTAEQGRLNQTSGEVEFWGDVVVLTETGSQLKTERLHYNDKREQLMTEDPFLYRAPRMQLQGVGLLVDLKKGTLVSEAQVEFVWQPEQGEVQP